MRRGEEGEQKQCSQVQLSSTQFDSRQSLAMAQTRRLSGLNQPSSTTAATQLSTGLMLETYEICQSSSRDTVLNDG